MSGLSRTPGKRVRVNSPPRVRIPLSPPIPCFTGYFFWLCPIKGLYPINGYGHLSNTVDKFDVDCNLRQYPNKKSL